MNFTKLLIILSGLSIILNNCGGLKEAGDVISNQKRKSTDEFLIKKKEPLTQPPDFERMPKPGSVKDTTASNKDNFKKIMQKNQTEFSEDNNNSTSTEESILKQIQK